ncbi:heteromeric transposase endonuclease subunit TnsA [Clostridium formicaceticum]|uniref:Transposase n=1 Tax=Clostridium formicaceticum TaxID=1497 RepID=A0AAC9WHS7_9CLOT|nr:heteromeric transposase endonuclease subunit TnsA [Clostridium formicaceticum]AOY74999.1 transposase [Clostridium formicaceticum]ARE89412.1 Transposon Tn7 transposition protein TnsA [Clostridium formicaceticum]
MAKRNSNFSMDKLNRMIREGRGQGTGKNYIPWLTIQDFPSKGRASRLVGWKTDRIHHFLTDTETRYFYLLEWNDSVVDIREHYPLLDFQEIVKEKEDLYIDLFKDKESGVLYVLSTSFLITLKDEKGDTFYAARSIKADYELERKLVLERLEIERRYWRSKNIDWGIVTQKDISVIKAKNIAWIHSSLLSSAERGLTIDEMNYYCIRFIERIHGNSKSIRVFTADFDKEFNLDVGTGLFIFKHLIASKKIQIDMLKKINISESIEDISITNKIGFKEVRVI